MKSSGFSLIELLLVIVVIGTSVFLLANLPNALNLITKSNHLGLAREIAAKAIEDKRSINYANLVTDASSVADSRMSLLPSSSGTIVVEDCIKETYPQYCPDDEHIKIVIVTINWKDNNKDQTISLNTFIGEGGINQ